MIAASDKEESVVREDQRSVVDDLPFGPHHVPWLGLGRGGPTQCAERSGQYPAECSSANNMLPTGLGKRRFDNFQSACPVLDNRSFAFPQ